jgi:nicotinate-nucleotide adenylyltransferase
VLGGSFDPVHIGHLAVAVAARAALGLDRVLLVVANDPWQKSADRQVAPAEERLALVEAAVAGLDGVVASRLEIDRGGPSYTADTLSELRCRWPGSPLFLVVGADVATQLDTWHRADELPGLATLVVAERAGGPAGPEPPGWTVVHLPVPRLDVSSSDLRRRLATGEPVDVLMPPAVIRRIAERGLYAVGR